MTKYVFVTGGVLSSVGKGIVAASIGKILASCGNNVTMIKIDPYINVDAGTMNPYMHGEVFVTDDGGETDLDLGHYERFLNTTLSKRNNITTGQIYQAVIMKERGGEYLGQCVQIIPHITDEIKSRIREVSKDFDVTVIEIGGTVGDIEGLPFLEAARQMRIEEGRENTFFVHVALVPILSVTGEQKTKPVQHSVQELRRIGIQPDAIVARCEKPLEDEAIRKISLFGNVPREAVFTSYNVETIYEVPIILEKQGLGRLILRELRFEKTSPDLSDLEEYVRKFKESSRVLTIAMVGKYTKLRDSYISIIEALSHSATHNHCRVKLKWIEATLVERNEIRVEEELADVDGVLVLPGFGKRGVKGKIKAIKYARERNIPTLGICFGMQLAVVEFARNVVGLNNANTTEVDPNTPHPVIDLLEEQRELEALGGTMRLGSEAIRLVKGTLVYRLYNRDVVFERHRHRYEVNPRYVDLLESSGMKISGYSVKKSLVEFVELPGNTFFVGCQCHPEYKSRPTDPAPVFKGFISKIISLT